MLNVVIILQLFFLFVKKNISTKFDIFYKAKFQNTIEIAIPTISAIKATIKTNLIFFIFTQPEYTAIVYNVVSVDPIIVETISPIFESTP